MCFPLFIFCFFFSVICTPGYYGVANGTCLQCPSGTYQPDEGSTECLKCPFLLSLTEPGALRESQCIDICKIYQDFPCSFNCPRRVLAHEPRRHRCSPRVNVLRVEIYCSYTSLCACRHLPFQRK